MTKEDYIKEVKEIEKQRELKILNLVREYALSNNPYSVGDIIKDHIGSILIDRIRVAQNNISRDTPCCVYEGVEIKKDGNPTKRANRRAIWQFNIVQS